MHGFRQNRQGKQWLLKSSIAREMRQLSKELSEELGELSIEAGTPFKLRRTERLSGRMPPIHSSGDQGKETLVQLAFKMALKKSSLVILVAVLGSALLVDTPTMAGEGKRPALSKCGPYFVYVDREIYKRKGCGFSPCFTFSLDAPEVSSETVREAFTIVHQGSKRPRVLYSGRTIPRKNLQPVPFSWSVAEWYGAGSYIVDGGERHYCAPY